MRCFFFQFFVYIILYGLFLPSLFAQADSLNTVKYYQQAEALLLKGKTDKAVKFFRKATVANPEFTAAWRGLGTCYELMENYDLTTVHYQKVIDLNPNFSRVIYYELGRAFYRNEQYKKALTLFNQFETLQARSIQLYGFNGEKEQPIEANYLEQLPRSIRECKNALELLNFSNVRYVKNLGDSINTSNNEDFGLNPRATKQLDKLFATFGTPNFTKVEVIGYADITGDSEYNQDLSRKRAANVAKYLALNGLNSEELVTLGQGENNQFDKKRLNRRVEIQFY